MSRFKHQQVTEGVIQAFYRVYSKLGYGFAESLYEQAMVLELRRAGTDVQQQAPISVYYDGHEIGTYFADLLVEEAVIVELKAARTLADEHEAQLLNYLKATTCEVGLLLNFGPEPQIKRKVFDNDRKGSLSWTDPSTDNTDVSTD